MAARNTYRKALSEIVNCLNYDSLQDYIDDKTFADMTLENKLKKSSTASRHLEVLNTYWFDLVLNYYEMKLSREGETLDEWDVSSFRSLIKHFGVYAPKISLLASAGNETINSVLEKIDDGLFKDKPRLTKLFNRIDLNGYNALLEAEDKSIAQLRRVVPGKTGLKEIFNYYHSPGENGDNWLPASFLDKVLGIDKNKIERSVDFEALKERYPKEDLCPEFFEGIYTMDTSYSFTREFIRAAKPAATDIVYDLGAFHGRVGFYGALTTDAKYKCVEIAPERVNAGQETKDRLGIDNLEFIQGDVKDVDYSDGTIFYLFNPFTARTFRKVISELKNIAKTKTITLGVNYDERNRFSSLDWLEKVSDEDDPTGLIIYRSKEIRTPRPKLPT
jgi:hypothetical protein